MDYKIFGCKVNKFYLSKWLSYFNRQNFSVENKVIISTCVVTDRAKSKWLKEAKTILNEWKEVLITWCGNLDKWWIIDYDNFYNIYPELKDFKNKITLLPEDPADANEMIWIWEYDLNQDFNIVWEDEDVQLYTKKFIVIQNWCDTNCTFCLTIKKRWANRSRTAEEIINEIKQFEESWWKEIVLTGINLAAWWSSNTRNPNESKFSDLLEQILEKTSIPRIRISSLWPEFLDDKFFEIVSNERFLPHFHFSIQSFSDNTLKLMNRNYDSQLLDNVLRKIRKLDRFDKDYISIWADIIVWFPGETDEDFNKTLEWIKKYWITKLHAFPFSAHTKWETIAASKFPNQISKEIKKQREDLLIQLWDKTREEFIKKNKWKTFEVMLEEQKNWKWVWWTGNYIQVFSEWDYNKWDVIKIKL